MLEVLVVLVLGAAGEHLEHVVDTIQWEGVEIGKHPGNVLLKHLREGGRGGVGGGVARRVEKGTSRFKIVNGRVRNRDTKMS